MCKEGIIRTYISDHHDIFCIVDNIMPHNNKQNTISKINLCDKNVTLFNRYLENETWDIVYRIKRVCTPCAAVCWIALTNILFIDESMAVQMIFFECIVWN